MSRLIIQANSNSSSHLLSTWGISWKCPLTVGLLGQSSRYCDKTQHSGYQSQHRRNTVERLHVERGSSSFGFPSRFGWVRYARELSRTIELSFRFIACPTVVLGLSYLMVSFLCFFVFVSRPTCSAPAD